MNPGKKKMERREKGGWRSKKTKKRYEVHNRGGAKTWGKEEGSGRRL